MSSLRTIPQSELRNNLGEILRRTEQGESFVVTVEGQAVAQLSPYPSRQWVPRAEVLKLLQTGKPDPTFFDDISALELRDV